MLFYTFVLSVVVFAAGASLLARSVKRTDHGTDHDTAPAVTTEVIYGAGGGGTA